MSRSCVRSLAGELTRSSDSGRHFGWIDHLRWSNEALAGLLSEAFVLAHPLIIGELACGNSKNRTELLGYLNALPSATVASNEEVTHLIEDRKLAGCGIGWVDAHLLASALLSNGIFWTADEPLQRAAGQTGVKLYSAARHS